MSNLNPCKSCKFYDQGMCKRHAPITFAEYVAYSFPIPQRSFMSPPVNTSSPYPIFIPHWPYMLADQGCGDHEP